MEVGAFFGQKKLYCVYNSVMEQFGFSWGVWPHICSCSKALKAVVRFIVHGNCLFLNVKERRVCFASLPLSN